jgi:hypothetical protein
MFCKKSILVITGVSLLFLACKEKSKRAKIHHDTILQLTEIVADSVIDYADAIRSGNRSLSIQVTENYLHLISRTIDSIENKNNFEGDTSLCSTSIALLKFYQGFITENFVPYFNSLANDSLTEQQLMIADSLHRKMMDEEAVYWSHFNNAEKKFSNKYDLSSIE